MSDKATPALNCLLPITVDNLSLAMNDRVLIDRITCQIKGNGITVIMGPNGAGKSLFLRCLHGLVEPDSGQVYFAGEPPSPAIRQRQLVMMRQ